MKSVILGPAKSDLQDLRRYIINKFGNKTWLETRSKIQQSIKQVEDFPLKGSNPPELIDFQPTKYYQVISGMNRIIYQIANDTIYIHIISDTRRDLKAILAKRLLRTWDLRSSHLPVLRGSLRLLPQHLAHTEPNFTLLAQRIRGRGHRSLIWRGTFTDLGSRDPRVNCSAGMYLWFQCPGERSSRGNRWDACVSIPRCRRLRIPQWPSVNGPDGRSAALAFLIPGVASRP